MSMARPSVRWTLEPLRAVGSMLSDMRGRAFGRHVWATSGRAHIEVRGMHREKRGRRLEDRVVKDLILLSYEGLDKTVRQTRIQCEPMPQTVSPSDLQFEIHLKPRQKTAVRLAISCSARMNGGSIQYTVNGEAMSANANGQFFNMTRVR